MGIQTHEMKQYFVRFKSKTSSSDTLPVSPFSSRATIFVCCRQMSRNKDVMLLVYTTAGMSSKANIWSLYEPSNLRRPTSHSSAAISAAAPSDRRLSPQAVWSGRVTPPIAAARVLSSSRCSRLRGKVGGRSRTTHTSACRRLRCPVEPL